MLRDLAIEAPQDIPPTSHVRNSPVSGDVKPPINVTPNFQPENLPFHGKPLNYSESECVPNVNKDVTISQPRSCPQRHIPNILRKSVTKKVTFKCSFSFYNVIISFS